MNTLSTEEAKAGYSLLFDGQTLDGWAATKKPEGWTVEDGMIVCSGKFHDYLYTREQFENFSFRLEYLTEASVNSGIFFRWSDLENPVHTGIEMQILDTFGVEQPGNKDSGAMYDMLAPSVNAVKPAGEWNQVEIRCQGSRIQFWLNQQPIIDTDIDQWDTPGLNPDGKTNKYANAWKDMPRRGHIGFQDHGGQVCFRNIRILTY